ncbi:MAG TPA: hypothetical protein VIW03_14665, partial [Anaeromyxobacter sp.]
MSVRAEDLVRGAPSAERGAHGGAVAPSRGGAEDEALLRPVLHTTWRFWAMAAVLGAVALWGANAYLVQFRWGLGVTGLNRPHYWGIYITNFVFFIGISHAGTLISAILRLARAEWRRAITRSAEVITVLVIFFGIGSI